MAADLLDQDQACLLDLIDDLTMLGIQNEVPLPQLIVCGNQSVGKSSLLEAISGIKFPIHTRQCTRFPTQIALRRSQSESYRVRIQPGKSASAETIERLKHFSPTSQSSDDLCPIIEEATQFMETAGERDLSDNVLVIEKARPDCPNLTLVDLPGLIVSTPDSESRYQIKMIRKLVSRFMARQESVILAVVSAETDFQIQSVLDMVKQHDPLGLRTIAVVTKVDLITGPTRRDDILRRARNVSQEFRGWHLVRNVDTDMDHSVESTRLESAEESTFFSKWPWNQLDPRDLGVPALRLRLTEILSAHIVKQLPIVIRSINEKLDYHKHQLGVLGPARGTLDDQRNYLTVIAENFQTHVNAALQSQYHDPILEPEGLWLRAHLERLKMTFVYHMLEYGSRYNIECSHPGYELRTDEQREWQKLPDDMFDFDLRYSQPTAVTCYDHAHDVEKRFIRNCKTLDLPTMVNPALLFNVTKDIIQPWQKITEDHISIAFEKVRCFVYELLTELADEHTCSMLREHHLEPELLKMSNHLKEKVQELLSPYKHIPPCSMNACMVFELVKLDTECRYPFPEGMRDPFAAAAFTVSHRLVHQAYVYVRRQQCSMIDNINTLAVENCLVKDLKALFTPSSLNKFGGDKIELVASETEHIAEKRRDHVMKRDKLSKALEKCEAYRSKSRARARSSGPTQSPNRIPNLYQPVPPLTPNRSPSPPSSRITTPAPTTPSPPKHAKASGFYKAPQVTDVPEGLHDLGLDEDDL